MAILSNLVSILSKGCTRVGPIYEKFSDQALNWSKVVPWHEKQSEAIIFQLS